MNGWKWLGVSVAVSGLAVAAFLSIISVNTPDYEYDGYKTASVATESEKVPEQEDYYLIKSSGEGIIVLYRDEKIKMFDMDLSALPEESKRALSKGIVVHDRQELAQRLEDYME